MFKCRVATLVGLVFGLLGSVPNLGLAQSLIDPTLRLSEVASGLSQPTAMAFIGAGDILVLQKNDGRVRRVINGTVQSAAVLDLTVENDSERGLLGIAVHPNFNSNKFVYLYFTHSGTTCGSTPADPPANRVCRYFWEGSALVGPTPIIDLPGTPGPNHNGGTMTFGPDGKLYIVIGDLNRNGQLQNFSKGPAPDDSGVILRLNDDGTFPTDNPFFLLGDNFRKYYAYGVRNSFGLAFDPLTDQLWDTENGPGDFDEINLVQPGFNSGWERIMGPVIRDGQGTGDLVPFTGSAYGDPKFSWLATVGPTALVFMDSPRLGLGYQDDLFVGDINNGRLYRFRVNALRNGFVFTAPGLSDLVADDGTELQELILGTGFGGITDLKVGPDGRLYILSFGLGKIFVVSGPNSQVDFDGDGEAETSVYRSGAWFILRSSDNGVTAIQFGVLTDVPVPADYDGDGKTDIALYRNGAWFILRSGDNGVTAIQFGVLTDVPVPADYDGDGKTDIALYRSGTWFILRSSDNGITAVTFGEVAGDIPVPADYDGDGKTDIALYRNGTWFILRSSDNGITGVTFGGLAGDLLVPADYDGDGKTDIALYRNDTWFILRSSDNGITGVTFGGVAGDIPVPADYDGDGKADMALYRSGTWFILRSSDNGITGTIWGGLAQDVPLN